MAIKAMNRRGPKTAPAIQALLLPTPESPSSGLSLPPIGGQRIFIVNVCVIVLTAPRWLISVGTTRGSSSGY